MAVEEKNILNRFYFIAGGMFIFAGLIVFKLVSIQFVEGNHYRDLAQQNTTKNFTIPANRGNIYSDDGSLLATSVPKYDIRFDAVTVSSKNFSEQLIPLSKALSRLLGRSVSHYQKILRKARADKNRYLLIARGLGYSDYVAVKNMPLFNLGPYKGGIIVEQKTVREHPLGKIGERLVGHARYDDPHIYDVGFEGAFDEFLRGKNGQRLKQKIAKGQWKPVSDENEVEPEDGFDIITTIDVNIQDIAHHALLKQLEDYDADHGCVIVMEVSTGEVKAVSNLARTKAGTYYEKYNYAVWEKHEPGSTFKTMAMMAALEDGVIDTSTVVDTRLGSKPFYGRMITDTKGHGKISAAKALEVSSNIGLASLIDDNYKDQPQKFIDHFKKWHLNKPIGIPIAGEGVPDIPEPGDEKWSRNALPSIAYGYNLEITPLQTLMFYNAIANDGKMVKPRFIQEIRKMNQIVESFETEVINKQICSEETLGEIQEILKNIVRRGTGTKLYSEHFPIAGKTGTARTEYWMSDWASNKRYISSFSGYFPADNPKYSCVVVIHKPSTKKGYYGADVTGPVFKRIAQKIYTDSPLIDVVDEVEVPLPQITSDFEQYHDQLQRAHKVVPNVVGMEGMDAVSLLENLGMNVVTKGQGEVKQQSLPSGEQLRKGKKIILSLS